MLIRFCLLLILGAISTFLGAFVLEKLALATLAKEAVQLGSIIMIFAFMLLFIMGLTEFFKLIGVTLSQYFSNQQRLQRKLFFYANQRNNLNQLFLQKKNRLLYINQQQRKQLLAKTDRKNVKK